MLSKQVYSIRSVVETPGQASKKLKQLSGKDCGQTKYLSTFYNTLSLWSAILPVILPQLRQFFTFLSAVHLLYHP